MFRGATLVNLDSKGRLSVPTRYRDQLIESAAGQMVCTIDIHHPCLLLLRQHAGLTKEVMLVGQFNKFELWDETTWYQQVKDDIDAEQSATGTLSERLQDLSL